LVQVDKSGVAHRPRSNQAVGQQLDNGDSRAKPAMDHQQTSITNFFSKPDVQKKQRLM
jgi:hypothetical protein